MARSGNTAALHFILEAETVKKFALAIVLSLAALTPTRAEACSSYWFAISGILAERTPGDSLARQAYELRKSRAWADLNACQRREREEKRQKVEEERQEQTDAQERLRLDQERTRADQDARAQAYVEEANRQANANLLATISTAILEGRCEDAKTVALTNSRLDLADQAMRLCKPGVRKPASATPQPTPATTYVPAMNVRFPPSEFSYDLPRPDGGKTCRYKKGGETAVAAGYVCPPFF